jgi:hypothetical protein
MAASTALSLLWRCIGAAPVSALGVPHIEQLIRPLGRTRRSVDAVLTGQQLGGAVGVEGAGEDFLPSVPYGGPNRYGFPL